MRRPTLRPRLVTALLCCSMFPLARAAVEPQDTAWQAVVQADLAAREYEITWRDRPVLADLDAAWQAPNRAQGFRTYFTESGIRVVPRTEPTPSWEWGLSWVGYGRGAASRTPPAAMPAPEKNRIAYRRGAFEESYENSPRGLEQGFVLPDAPEGPAAAGFVHLDLSLSGNLSPIISADGQAVDFVTPSGVRALRYGELHVTDARGVELRAWIEGFSNEGLRGIRLVFDARDAVYPVTVDPLATSPAWTVDGDQEFASLGYAVATAGDVNGDGYSDVVVSAPGYDNGQEDEGRVFVFHGSPAGVSISPAWVAESDQVGAEFGVSVATAGDVNGDGYADVIVGAWLYDNGQNEEGRAYVYHGSAAGLQASPAWTAEGDQTFANFGVSVATAGDVNGDGYSDVVVGAWEYNNGQANGGRAYVYHGSSAGLVTSPSWTAEGDQSNANFGVSVATAGDVNGDGYADLVVGAYRHDGIQPNDGRAYVYNGSALGLQTSPAWTAEGGQFGAQFGSTVATAGDVNGDGYADVVVAADSYDNGGADEGRAYVYHGSAAGLQTTPAWTAAGSQANGMFGFSLATAGDVNGDGYADVVVGQWHYTNVQLVEGRALVYQGSALGLLTVPAWTAEGDQPDAQFGVSVATAGDVNGDGYADVIVGAFGYNNGQTKQGRAAVYNGSAAGLATRAGWAAESDHPGSFFGISVAQAGDVNGDGYADVIVGAYFFDNGQGAEGRAFAYHGSATGLQASPVWTADSDQVGANFGVSVATAGDVNGDGYADVIVGAETYDNDQNAEGRAFVYHGSAAGLQTSPAWTAEADREFGGFGISVATAGDVNGDGYADVIIGASGYDNGEMEEGRAFVYHGSAAGLATSAAWTAEGNQGNARFGSSVATAGDVNGDGYSDVIVGARFYGNGQLAEGRAFVYHGSAAGLSVNTAWTAESNQLDAQLGWSVATAGDVNGDGYADVIVGAHTYDNGQVNEGRAFVYHGSATGLQASPAWTAESDQGEAQFGHSVATAGDVNGDGYADVIVGAYLYGNGQVAEGRAFVYHGSAAGLSTSPAWTGESNQADARFGVSVATAGDVNGDGYADVIVGAYVFDNDQANEGRVFAYYGNGGRGLSLNPRQRRADDGGPIAHLGASDSPDSFRLALLGRTPFGRGRVQFEWEVKPLGAPLDGSGATVAGAFNDTGLSGVPLSELAAGLSGATPYHWRVRLRYDSATTPFARHSRWLTMPWKGWQESMLRTAAAAGAGRVPDGSTGAPLLLDKASGGTIALTWDASCLAADTDYAIYEGVLGNFTSHDSRFCGTGGATTKTFAPLAGDTYYLVVPLNAFREGSYGTDSSGAERPQGLDACLPQEIEVCP